ncbi:hypothetical protein [Streptomyces hydrogenans]
MERTAFPLDLLMAKTRATAAYPALAVPPPCPHGRALLRRETFVHHHPCWTTYRSAGGRADLRPAARAELTHHERQEMVA